MFELKTISKDWNLHKEVHIYETKQAAENYANYIKSINPNVSIEIKEIDKIETPNNWG